MIEIKNFVKKEIVLCTVIILAVISMFFVRPNAEYISYIDFRTLAILFWVSVWYIHMMGDNPFLYFRF